jgi:hypothetical protein
LASEAIAAVEAANELLRQAAMEPSLGNLAALEAAWQDRALARAQAFAQDLSQQYRRALEISFVYLGTPTAQEGDTPGTAIVTSTEVWTYTTSLSSRSEAFDFIYTLERRDAAWVITNYTYRNAPNALPPAPVETRGVLTGTNVLTATTPITSQP